MPPTRLAAYNTSSTSVMVTWLPVPDGYVHGILRGYRLFFKIDEDRFYQNVTTLNQSFELTGLEKFTNYSVKVLAFTRIGDGNVSDPVLVSTDEDGKLLAHLQHSLLRARTFYDFYACYTHSNLCCISFHMISFLQSLTMIYMENKIKQM